MIRRFILFCVALLATGPCLAAATSQDCPECPEMIVVPAGTFKMGSSQAELNNNEGPQHTVTIRKAFAVGIYTVTFDQWDACVFDGGCAGYSPPSQDGSRGKRPVVNVSWHDAQIYVGWLNEKLRDLQPIAEGAPASGPYRLLSEADWEYAARAGTTTAYYWGEARRKGYANCDGCGSEWDNTQTAPVGSFPPNPFGLYDMAGNVLQWTQDCYHENYTGAPANGSAWITGPIGACSARMMRGGSWFNSTYYLRSSQRYIVSPHFRAHNAGFRVAKTLD